MNSNKNEKLFTKGEEIFNAVTHIVGGVFGVIVLIVGIVCAAIYNDVYAIVSMTIYGLCMILAYTASSIYHFLRQNKAKRLFRIFDHCTIFLLIAGTYTPYCLVLLRGVGPWGWTLFGILWGLAILGIISKSIDMHNKTVRVLGMGTYLVMGWCAVIAIVPIWEVFHPVGFWLTVAGGIVYTIGAIFYAFGRKVKYIHSVWHLFVLCGSILHFFAILFYVIL